MSSFSPTEVCCLPLRASTACRWRLAARAGNHACAKLRVQAWGRMHVRIDQTIVDVALGLDHHGVGGLGSAFGGFVAFVRQRQAGVRLGRFRATRRWGLLPFDETAGPCVYGHLGRSTSRHRPQGRMRPVPDARVPQNWRYPCDDGLALARFACFGATGKQGLQ